MTAFKQTHQIQRGFDFLGYRFSRQPLRLAALTVARFNARYHRLYERQQNGANGAAVLGDYVIHWRRWAAAGLGGLDLALESTSEAEAQKT